LYREGSLWLFWGASSAIFSYAGDACVYRLEFNGEHLVKQNLLRIEPAGDLAGGSPSFKRVFFTGEELGMEVGIFMDFGRLPEYAFVRLRQDLSGGEAYRPFWDDASPDYGYALPSLAEVCQMSTSLLDTGLLGEDGFYKVCSFPGAEAILKIEDLPWRDGNIELEIKPQTYTLEYEDTKEFQGGQCRWSWENTAFLGEAGPADVTSSRIPFSLMRSSAFFAPLVSVNEEENLAELNLSTWLPPAYRALAAVVVNGSLLVWNNGSFVPFSMENFDSYNPLPGGTLEELARVPFCYENGAPALPSDLSADFVIFTYPSELQPSQALERGDYCLNILHWKNVGCGQ